jgi:hypothetical protein
MAKHGVVVDVEDRIVDEIKELGSLKNEFMKLISSCADEKRGVFYSELLYDEALQLLVKITEDFSTQLQVGKVQDTIRGIYHFRTVAQTKDRFLPLLSRLELHSQVVGGLLGTSSFHKDLLLETFYGHALPTVLRNQVWRALMRNPQAEQQYLHELMHDRWKTISRNEVEIVRRSQEMFAEHCPSLAYNHDAVIGMKTVLSYYENLISHRLPDFLYYMIIPIMFTFSDTLKLPEQLIGIALKFGEIQSTVFAFEGPMWAQFTRCLAGVSSSLTEKVKSLLNLTLTPSQEKLDEFVQPFVARLTSGYMQIEVTCLVYDQLVMCNCASYLFYVLCVLLILIEDSLQKVRTWDDFVEVFRTLAKRVTVPELESVLHLIPQTASFDELEAVPPRLQGRDYLDYINTMQEEALTNSRPNEVLLSQDPTAGLVTRQISKGNLMEVMLNKIGRSPGEVNKGSLLTAFMNKDNRSPSAFSKSLLKANLDSINSSKESSRASPLRASRPRNTQQKRQSDPSYPQLNQSDPAYPLLKVSPANDKSRVSDKSSSFAQDPAKAKLLMRQGLIPFVDLDDMQPDVLEGFKF